MAVHLPVDQASPLQAIAHAGPGGRPLSGRAHQLRERERRLGVEAGESVHFGGRQLKRRELGLRAGATSGLRSRRDIPNRMVCSSRA